MMIARHVAGRFVTRDLLLTVAIGSLATPLAARIPVVSPEEKAAATLRQMSAAEKIDLLHGPMILMMPKAERPQNIPFSAGYVKGVPRLGVPMLVESDASLGVANVMEMRKGDVATAMPSGMAQAAAWDPAVAHAGGAMIGAEARSKGFNVMLAGGADLVRDPRGGRSFEYLGEDPLLAGTLAGAQIAGVQSNHIISTIKHFALNDQEIGRHIANVEMDEAAMRESDLLAFEIGIEKGNPGSVMCAYNRVNGTYACENDFLLNRVLKHDWGFKGYVMSDWGAVHSAGAITKGLDQQSGEQIDGKPYFSGLLVKALAAGEVPQSAVDMAARRVLYAIYAQGLDMHTAVAVRPVDHDANAEVAQRAEEAGIVLLRNQGDLLPLAASAKKIAVIGGNADAGVPSGGGSSQVVPVGGFKRIQKLSSAKTPIWLQFGYGGTAPLDALRGELPDARISYSDGKDIATAVAAAKAADIVIVFADKLATEGMDQPDLSLGGGQDALIEAVAAANPKTVVVLETGNPVTMPWRDQVPAILSAWYGGQRGGAAIARVLTGKVNPSGHLPVTFPASVDQLPNPRLPGSDAPPPDKETRSLYSIQAETQPFDIRYPEGADVGYRWYDRKGLKPLYPFGYGLSYTSFRYDDLHVSDSRELTVTFRVTNTGTRRGADVPQVYVVRPGKAKRLIGWGKPDLEPGQSRVVTVTADPRVLADFDVKAQSWVVPAEQVRIEIARSAADPVLTANTRLRRETIRP